MYQFSLLNCYLLFKSDNGYACVAFAELCEMEFGNVLQAAEIVVDAFAQGAGSFSVDNADAGQMCQICVVQIFIQFCDRLVHRLAKKIDLGGDGSGFGEFQFSRSGFRQRRSGNHRLVHQYQIGDMHL